MPAGDAQALRTFWQAGLLHDTLTSADVPKGIGLPLNTTAFGLVAPAMAKKWPGRPMAVTLNVSGALARISNSCCGCGCSLWLSLLHHPELRISMPAHTKHPG